MKFVSPDKGNPFDLDIQQPISVYENGVVIARLMNSTQVFVNQIDFIAKQNGIDIDQYNDVDGIEFEDDEDDIDDAFEDFGYPLSPADWQLVNPPSNDAENYLRRLDIVRNFLTQHREFYCIQNNLS